MNVKFHSSQEVTNQSIVMNVFRNTNQKAEEAQVVEDLAVEEALAVEEVLAAEEDLTEDHVKCTKLLVETAARHVKCHSSQKVTNQSIAANVFKVIEETKKIILV
jgi:hypothetical protein